MRRRILVSYVSLTLLVLLLLEIPLGLFFADRERERFTNGVLSDAGVLASLYEDALDQGDPLTTAPAEDYAARTAARVLVVDASGTSIVDTDSAPGRSFISRPEVATALAGNRSAGERFSETLAEDLLVVAVPVASGGAVHGAVRVSLPVSDVDERVERFWLGLAGIGGLVLVGVSAIGWAVATSMTSPIRELEETAAAFGHGRLAPRDPPSGAPREVRALHESLNAMATRLRQLLDEQRAFVADASHQLRTPLTALRLRLENLAAEVEPARHPDLDAASREVERLGLLVEQLLQLARSEQGRPAVSVDAVAVVTDRVDTWGAVAEAAGVELVATIPATPLRIDLRPDALEQIVDNLIDNAIAASTPGGVVQVALTGDSTMIDLHVIDHGIGLGDADKARALDRFWRGAAASDGTGLGLAIVDSLAAQHGGGVDLSDTPGGGLTVVVHLAAP